jgi:hypothetical protein
MVSLLAPCVMALVIGSTAGYFVHSAFIAGVSAAGFVGAWIAAGRYSRPGR